jgi:CheY-like chemotaxis protein
MEEGRAFFRGVGRRSRGLRRWGRRLRSRSPGAESISTHVNIRAHLGVTLGRPTVTGSDGVGPAVLVVDDNASKRLAIKAMILPLGFTVVEAESGIAALRCIMKDNFAAVLMDIRMPGMDGYETTRLISDRQQSDATPVIFFTANDRSEIQTAEGYASGGVDFVFSPFVAAEIQAKLSVFGELFLKNQDLADSVCDLREQLAAALDELDAARRQAPASLTGARSAGNRPPVHVA